jgi:hypothetical protein
MVVRILHDHPGARASAVRGYFKRAALCHGLLARSGWERMSLVPPRIRYGGDVGLQMIKTAMGWLELPHWLIIAGATLVVVGLIGLVIGRRHRAKVQDNPATEPSPEPPPQLPPLPDLLDSRPRTSRR